MRQNIPSMLTGMRIDNAQIHAALQAQHCYVSSCRAFNIRLRTLSPSWQTECNARDHMVEYLDWCSRPPMELRRSPTDLADEEEGVHQPLPPPPQRVSGDFPVAHHSVLLQVPGCRREQQKYNEITRHNLDRQSSADPPYTWALQQKDRPDSRAMQIAAPLASDQQQHAVQGARGDEGEEAGAKQQAGLPKCVGQPQHAGTHHCNEKIPAGFEGAALLLLCATPSCHHHHTMKI